MKKKTVLYVCMIVLGMLLIAFPIISNYLNLYRQTIVMSDYQNTIQNLSEKEKKEELQNAQNYNNKLEQSTIIDLSLNNNEKNSTTKYINVLNVGDTMGYISIPKIDVYFPIYHGISDSVLQSGVGHIEKSSLPIGGKNTHAVLAGHSGLARVKIFDDLNKLEEGDRFYIYVLDNTLTYEVDKIDIVLPSDTETIKLDENKDYVTLVTCTPRILNTHRLLERGSRVEENLENEEQTINSNDIKEVNKNAEEENAIFNLSELKNKNRNKLFFSCILLFILFIALTFFLLIKK